MSLNVSDPLPFMLAVIYGANCSFATPIAYQTNMLVMGPGHLNSGISSASADRLFLCFGACLRSAPLGGSICKCSV
jgi:hypothetical protein